jgi:hypothetical protein
LGGLHTGVADAGVVDLNADLVGLGGSDLDVLDGELLSGLPGNGSLHKVGLMGKYVGVVTALGAAHLAGNGLGKKHPLAKQLPKSSSAAESRQGGRRQKDAAGGINWGQCNSPFQQCRRT